LSVMTADQKVINYFAHILQQSKSDIIELLHNRSCLAVFLGMKPETLSRALKRLQERYIEVQGRKILIKDTHFFREKYLELEVDL